MAQGTIQSRDLLLKQSFEFHFKDYFGLTIRIEYFGASMYLLIPKYCFKITVIYKTKFGYKLGFKLRQQLTLKI